MKNTILKTMQKETLHVFKLMAAVVFIFAWAAAQEKQTAWRVALEEGKSTRATLTIGNRCAEPHLFRIKTGAKYLTFEGPTKSVPIAPGSTTQLWARFDATGLKSKIYEDDVLVECLDCKKEKATRCTQDRDKVPVVLTVTRAAVVDRLFAQSAWVPANSKVSGTGNRQVITPPAGWVYVGFDAQRNFVSAAGGTTISCDCTGQGACLPFKASGLGGSTAGCAGSCTACNMSQALVRPNGTPVWLHTGGYINYSYGITPAKAGEALPSGFDAMFADQRVQKGFEEFLNKAYRGKQIPTPNLNEGRLGLPEGHAFMSLNVYGRGVVTIVPAEFARASNGTTGAPSCSCSNGTCTVKTKTVLIGSAAWCEGNCGGTCSLSGARGGSGAPGTTELFTFYRF